MLRFVRLRNFRNYEHLDLELAARFNVVSGPNAQGKTNLLEALYLISTARLLRGMRDKEAIRETAHEAVVEGELHPSGTRVAVELKDAGRKRALLNGLALPRASDILGRIPTVCISPLDMELVRGEPGERRLFLDLELSAMHAGYLRHLAGYKRALEQRNALLRQAAETPVSTTSFEPWECSLAHHGAALRAARNEYVAELAAFAREFQAALGDGERLALTYAPRDEGSTEEALLSAYATGRGSEIARGTTLSGPHRDDLRVDIDGREARLFASQGQQRSAVLALKFGSMRIWTLQRGEQPVLLLDDILSDLDARRRRLLVELTLREAGQAVLTCTEPEAAGSDVLELASVFEVRSGTVTRR